MTTKPDKTPPAVSYKPTFFELAAEAFLWAFVERVYADVQPPIPHAERLALSGVVSIARR